VARGEHLPPRLAGWIVANAAAGLHAAHELRSADGQPRDVVHRDVSPHNVFVTTGGLVKVLDFGIARASERRTHTDTGHIKGKIRYMSPEQLRAEPLDRRADVWSLGVVLHELLAERALFRCDGVPATMSAILDGPIPAIERSDDVEIGRALEEIARRALERDVRRRFATARDFRAALVACLASHGVSTIELEEELAALLLRLAPDAESEEAALREAAVRHGAGIAPRGAAIARGARSDVARRPGDRSARGALLVVLGIAVGAGAALALSWSGVAPRDVAGDRTSAPPATLATAAPRPPGGPPASASDSAAASASASASDSASASASAPVSERIELRFDGVPVGARVSVGGVVYGHLPLVLRYARGTEPVDVRVEHEGHRADVFRVPTDADRALRVALRPELPESAVEPSTDRATAAGAPVQRATVRPRAPRAAREREAPRRDFPRFGSSER
jgi:hypothetical protein